MEGVGLLHPAAGKEAARPKKQPPTIQRAKNKEHLSAV
jgi:hypothetical protein